MSIVAHTTMRTRTIENTIPNSIKVSSDDESNKIKVVAEVSKDNNDTVITQCVIDSINACNCTPKDSNELPNKIQNYVSERKYSDYSLMDLFVLLILMYIIYKLFTQRK